MINRRDRIVRAVAVAVVAVLIFAACGGGAPATTQGGSVKIGGLTFITGKFATTGKLAQEGMELAVEQVNAKGGVLGGSKLVLDLQDTASEQTQAISLARKLAGDPEVMAIVGPTGSPDTLAMLSIGKELGVGLLAIGGVVSIEPDKFPDGMVRVALIETPTILKSFLSQVGSAKSVKKVALLSDRTNDSFTAKAAIVRQVAPQANVTLAGDETFAVSDTSFSTQLDKTLQAAPDAIWIAGTTPANALIMQQARARGFKGLFIEGSGFQDPAAAKLAGAAATGYVTFLPYVLDSEDKLVKDFVAAHKAKFPSSQIGALTVYAYDAVLLLADAINRAGSKDRTKIMKALGAIKDVATIEGPYTFSGKGDNVNSKLNLVEMGADGTFKPLK